MKSAILTICSSAALVLSGCASFRNAAPGDPLEPINRRHFFSNSTFDHYPVQADRQRLATLRCPVPKKGVSNVFQNASDAQSIVSDALQLEGARWAMISAV